MTALHTDRFLRLIEPPAFLAGLGPKDRMLWRVALAPVLVVAATVLVGIVTQAASGWLSDRLARAAGLACPADGGLTCADLAMMQQAVWFAAASLAVLAALALLMGRRMETWISAAGRIRWRLFLLGLAGAALVLAPANWLATHVVGSAGAPPLAGPEALWSKGLYILACLAFLPVWAFFEEVLFRGWLLQQFAALTRNLLAILLIDALIFAFSHGQTDIGASVSHTVFGLVLGYAVLRLGGLEFAVGAHAANNLLLALLVETVLRGDPAKVATWAQIGLDAVGSLAIVIVVEIVARVPALAAWAGVSPSAAAAPEPSAPEAIPEDHP